MTISKDTILKIADLAKISISEDQIDKLEIEISSILNWVENLNEVDTENIEPMSNSLTNFLQMREDIVNDGEKGSEILSNSPAEDKSFFVVPKVIE